MVDGPQSRIFDGGEPAAREEAICSGWVRPRGLSRCRPHPPPPLVLSTLSPDTRLEGGRPSRRLGRGLDPAVRSLDTMFRLRGVITAGTFFPLRGRGPSRRGSDNDVVLPDFSVSRRHAACAGARGWVVYTSRAPTGAGQRRHRKKAAAQRRPLKSHFAFLVEAADPRRAPPGARPARSAAAGGRTRRRISSPPSPPARRLPPTRLEQILSRAPPRGQAQGPRPGLQQHHLRHHDAAGTPADQGELRLRGARDGDRHRLRGAVGRPRLHPPARRPQRRADLRAVARRRQGGDPPRRGAGVEDHAGGGDQGARGAAHLRRAVGPAPRHRRVDPHPSHPLGDVRAAVVGREHHRCHAGGLAVPRRHLQRGGPRSLHRPLQLRGGGGRAHPLRRARRAREALRSRPSATTRRR